MDTLSGFKHPSKYDAQFLLKPTSKANTKLILAEEDNIKHVFASLATKVTSQSVIIGEFSARVRSMSVREMNQSAEGRSGADVIGKQGVHVIADAIAQIVADGAHTV